MATGCAADAFVAPLATCSFSPWLSGLDGRFLSAAGRRKYRHLDKCIVVRLPMSVSEADSWRHHRTPRPAGASLFRFEGAATHAVPAGPFGARRRGRRVRVNPGPCGASRDRGSRSAARCRAQPSSVGAHDRTRPLRTAERARASLKETVQVNSQATKSQRWMPWRQMPMKDVGGCEKPRGAVDQALIRGYPNGETRLGSCPVTPA